MSQFVINGTLEGIVSPSKAYLALENKLYLKGTRVKT